MAKVSPNSRQAHRFDLYSDFSFLCVTRLSVSLGLEGDVDVLNDKVHLHRLPDRYTLVKEGEQLNKLFFVIHGSIAAYMREINGAKRESKNSVGEIMSCDVRSFRSDVHQSRK